MDYYEEIDKIMDIYNPFLLEFELKARAEREMLGLDNPENVMTYFHPLSSRSNKGMAITKGKDNILFLNLLNLIDENLDLDSNKKRELLIEKLAGFEEKNGKDFLNNTNFFEENNELLKHYFSWHPIKLNKESFDIFRHEYEHLAHGNSYLDNICRTEDVFERLKHKSVRDPIFESRANMFSYVPAFKWQEVNYKEIGLKLYDDIISNYFMPFANTCFDLLSDELDSDDKHKFLCESYINNTKLAVLSTVKAFEEDPTRLNEATHAKDIKEYAAICYDK